VENNNSKSTANYFTSGVDLVATSVSGPAQSGPDSTITVPVSWFNQGSDNIGSVQFKIWLSTDNILLANDYALFTDTRMVSGWQPFFDNLSFTCPDSVHGGVNF